MKDAESWQRFFQGLAAIAVIVGGIFAGWFGTRKTRNGNPSPSDAYDERERQRIKDLETQVIENRIREDFGQVIEATRRSFEDEIRRMEHDRNRECAKLENMIRENREKLSDLRAEVASLGGRNSRQR